VGTKERRERERVDTRERILAAAREMFAEEGYEAVTMRAIAERIEYTPTALYHHFPSKQALLTELCESDFAGLAKHFQGAAGSADPVERLRAVGDAYLRFAEQYPSQYRFMFMTVLPEVEHAPDFLSAKRDNPEHSAYAFLRQACRDAIDKGRLRPEYADPDQVAQMLWASVHGLISLQMAKRHDAFVPWRDLRKTTRLMIDTMTRGMLRTS